MFYRRVGDGSFPIYLQIHGLRTVDGIKISVIDQFVASKIVSYLYISIGYSYGDGKHDEIGRNLLNRSSWWGSALSRKMMNREKPYFLWWGNSFGCEADSDSHTLE